LQAVKNDQFQPNPGCFSKEPGWRESGILTWRGNSCQVLGIVCGGGAGGCGNGTGLIVVPGNAPDRRGPKLLQEKQGKSRPLSRLWQSRGRIWQDFFALLFVYTDV
jgi:hypothetical protein